MTTSDESIRARIRHRIIELASELRHDASSLGDDELIPQSGVLDSAAILALIIWCEAEFGVVLELEEINLENFGTIARMSSHLSSLLPEE
jgi:acyl carrier protein